MNKETFLNNLERDTFHIYTDGGSRGNGSDDALGAWAFYAVYNNHEKLESVAVKNKTNNQMELKAIIKGLSFIHPSFRSQKVVVYSDSSYCLQGIQNWIKGWKKNGWRTAQKKAVKNKELWQEFDEIKETFSNISFIKVKGHSGEFGNELVDSALNTAMDDYLENQE